MINITKVPRFFRSPVLHNAILTKMSKFSTTTCACGRKSRNPYDRRFPNTLLGRDVGLRKPGGSQKLASEIGMREDMPQPPGMTNKRGRFQIIPEMIPEFVVPDLKDFKLKPYVSYKVPDVTQTEFTAKDLFKATYGKSVMQKHRGGKLDLKSSSLEDLVKDTDLKKS